MRIGLDARFLTHPQRGGFKTYTLNLIAALAEVDGANEYVLYVDRPPSPSAPVLQRANFRTVVVDGTAPIIGMPYREQWGLARRARADRLDLFHSLSLTAPLWLDCPLVVTLHDMIWRRPELYSGPKPFSPQRSLMDAYYRWVPDNAARRAACIITVSHAARESILKELALEPARVIAIHEAASPIFRRLEADADWAQRRRALGLTGEYVLAIGSADPRKNLPTLIRAFAALPAELRQNHQLAIVWTHHFLASGLTELIEGSGLAEAVVFLKNIPDDDLTRLYNSATAFAFPSRYEGFGLPLLEAMACGAPVLAANNSSIPEIVGEAGLLVGAEDQAAMSEALARLLSEPELRRSLRRAGLNRAATFSWERCAQETVGVYADSVTRVATAASGF